MTAPFNALLIANRGEIAIRIARACADLGIRSVAVFAEDDAASLHVRKADVALPLAGRGVAAYLDMDRLVALALEQGCEAIHPGYGFLAENGEFARRCQRAGIQFVGPQAEVLDLFGDKAAARALAERLEVPLVAGINRAVSVEEAEAFLEGLGDGAAVMLKALAGGGGRGMRAVEEVAQLADAYRRCRAEAQAAFGRDELYVEQRVARARHIEVQVLGDGSGAVSHLWERDCSLQRRQQKLLEIAPSPDLPEATREALIDCALRMAGAVRYRGIGTFEFLVDDERPGRFYFMEANPRIQVEHTVTEEVTGVDLLHAQLRLAAGMELAALGLERPPAIGGCAVQLRINLETLAADGSARPAVGTIGAYEPPSGPGLRVDGYGYAGYRVSPSYDSLGTHLGQAAGGQVELAVQVIDHTGHLGIQLGLGLGVLVAGLAGRRRHPPALEQRQAETQADTVGVVFLLVGAFRSRVRLAAAGVEAEPGQVAGTIALHLVGRRLQRIALGAQLGAALQGHLAPAFEGRRLQAQRREALDGRGQFAILQCLPEHRLQRTRRSRRTA